MEPAQEWFNAIYAKNYSTMIRLAHRMLGDAHMAEDIVQSAFLTLLTKREVLQDHPNIQAWLVVTVKNQILNERQKAYHSHEVELDLTHAPAAEDTYDSDFRSLLPDGLNDSERLLLYLYFDVGLPHEELAAKIGCSPEACRMRLSRAKAHCKKLMQQENGENF